MAFGSSVQLLLPMSIRSLETLWATEVPRDGGAGAVESLGLPFPRVKPQAGRLLNPCENHHQALINPNPLEAFCMTSVTNKLLSSPPFPSQTSPWPLHLCSGYLPRVFWLKSNLLPSIPCCQRSHFAFQQPISRESLICQHLPGGTRQDP